MLVVNRSFGHGGAFEQLSLPLQLLFSNICVMTQVGTTQVSTAQVGIAQVGFAQDCFTQAGTAQTTPQNTNGCPLRPTRLRPRSSLPQ